MRRVILTTGGTGGHIFPALAVAEEIRARYPECSVLFMGGLYGPEADLAARAGLDFVGLPVRGVLGRGVRAIGAAFGMAAGIARAYAVMGRFDPDIVLGFGGYAAFAGVLAARLRGRPAAIHEQNSVPGVTNRVLSRVVPRVFLSLPDTLGAFPPQKTCLAGNPVRASIVACGAERSDPRPDHVRRLLVMGGSLGARAINDAVVSSLPALAEAGVEVWHQTGAADWERIRKAYAETGHGEGRVEAFIDDVASAYAWADLVLCRAGATSVAELAVAGKPAVLVPYPFATHDHQTHNARWLVSRGAAVLLEQKDISMTDVPALLVGLLSDRARLNRMAVSARAQGRPDAAAAVVDGLVELLKTTPRAR
ncbi:undecaprenyldiphospho-muramoylpentapeptide beta-N-acetylglucosaminyltransferase [Nitratidesulfovibrio vulgaris]|uniref:UDP-N-acetylglucosamine--N-acetylmuramyl-(pentapeptide) pyrophosphoryl-undecaprenol N-acetylglucosamine transferase n=1 Tax=Nitratidesulfovibrio vulgaris (strain DP4) TaxID=391774 RepID=MURG_NITV4|nr:undecaprenyldiphospho-muramoylpentapeptide beta-N-acetylglucosaminyltransferase [Nitratidesulfovibrio vulgaris]A1VBE8.1 RecName: Full=UDP-N-acetylglucosamine--N-acetylmuramyl-(pentapeptide) pyrophosphoryl-undecaprenol N-acetylglucosamine transferase; AltName: Full=Undecaprenyl-PP-MurNAc-pentapeptide-UDPGlcNAc GlcNAc transferase [Nitratidesulfovibrio vulgaris DP4]ABM27764.1 UDP-N-acetylglucosamine--N-acetylmuramyl-(pentapeptide) pyrophosphoryl-undecaprenol N-acetylglucosamine transferase [Nitra